MNRIPRMPITITTTNIGCESIGSALLRRVEAGLQRLELGVDLLGIAQLGDLLVERLGRGAQRQRVGPALGIVRPPPSSSSRFWGGPPAPGARPRPRASPPRRSSTSKREKASSTFGPAYIS